MKTKIIQPSFKQNLLTTIKNHPAISNPFLDRFAEGDVSKEEFFCFAREFYHFSRNFPVVLCTLLVNTPDENEAKELTTILSSELGDGNPENRHELLYRKFLRSIGIDPRQVMKTPMIPSTKEWIDCMISLYAHPNHFVALGASFGLENMAIPMWDKLLPGLNHAKNKWFPKMDETYFTFHRALEETHEHAMDQALEIHLHHSEMQSAFTEGVFRILEKEYGFWMGLQQQNPPSTSPSIKD